MEWSSEKILKFIKAYKAKPILWDPKNPKYYNKLEKNEAWEDVANIMEIHVDECKKKMASLLASLRREKMKTARSYKTGEEAYRSGWFAFKAMTFLLDRKNPNKTNDKDEDDVSEEEDPLEGSTETKPETSVDNSHNNAPVSNKHSPKRSSESTTFSSSFLKKKKRLNEDSLRPRVYETSTTAASYEDECNAFTKYVCSKLRQYSPEVRSRVQHEISTVLLQADLGQFQTYHYNHPGISSNHIYNPPSQQQQSLPSPEVNYDESSDALSPETEQKLDFSDLIDS